MKLILRGHHLLCLKGFQGYGYSDEFNKNMNKINSLRKLNETTISLVNHYDDICKYCPNLKGKICQNNEQNKKIIEMDNEVLSKIDKHQQFNGIELFEKINHIFSDKKSVAKICFNCIWQDKCLFYQNLD